MNSFILLCFYNDYYLFQKGTWILRKIFSVEDQVVVSRVRRRVNMVIDQLGNIVCFCHPVKD